MRTTDHSRSAAHPPFAYVLGTSAPAVITFVEAVESCLHDLEQRLVDAGCVIEDVVSVRAYVPSSVMTVTGYAEYNDVYNRFFGARGIFRKPARATVGIDQLRGIEVQMEACALRSTESSSQGEHRSC